MTVLREVGWLGFNGILSTQRRHAVVQLNIRNVFEIRQLHFSYMLGCHCKYRTTGCHVFCLSTCLSIP